MLSQQVGEALAGAAPVAGVDGEDAEPEPPVRVIACMWTCTVSAVFSSVRSSAGMLDCAGTASFSADHSAASFLSEACAALPVA